MQSAKGLPAPEVELSALGLLSSVNVSLRNVLVWQAMVQPQPQDRPQGL